MGERVFISIGSNLGDRQANCRSAIERFCGDCPDVRLITESPFYETEPWGYKEQGPFINAVIEVATAFPPRELLERIKSVESESGRTTGERWGPRVIDLDIVFYGERVMEEPDLVIPHPHAHDRAFVLAPMAEIAPGFVHPVLKKSVSELLGLINDDVGVKKSIPGSS